MYYFRSVNHILSFKYLAMLHPNKIKFQFIYCINKHCEKKEYLYSVFITSITGKLYVSYDNWTSYAINAMEAKRDILIRLNKSQAVDYVLEDEILKDSTGTPYFELREPSIWDMIQINK